MTIAHSGFVKWETFVAASACTSPESLDVNNVSTASDGFTP